MNKEFYFNFTDKELIAEKKQCEKDYNGYKGIEPDTAFLASEALKEVEMEMRRRGILNENGEIINSK